MELIPLNLLSQFLLVFYYFSFGNYTRKIVNEPSKKRFLLGLLFLFPIAARIIYIYIKDCFFINILSIELLIIPMGYLSSYLISKINKCHYKNIKPIKIIVFTLLLIGTTYFNINTNSILCVASIVIGFALGYILTRSGQIIKNDQLSFKIQQTFNTYKTYFALSMFITILFYCWISLIPPFIMLIIAYDFGKYIHYLTSKNQG